MYSVHAQKMALGWRPPRLLPYPQNPQSPTPQAHTTRDAATDQSVLYTVQQHPS